MQSGLGAQHTDTKKRAFTLTPIITPFLTAVLLLLISLSGKLLDSQADKSDNPTELLLLISVIQLMVFIFPCILYYFFKGRELNTPFMISGIRPGQIVFVIAAALLLISGNLLIKCFYYIGAGDIPSGVDYIVTDASSLSEAPVFAVVVAVALLPALCEEFFFRGVVLSEYRIYGTFNAVVFSALCFAMIHFSLSSFPLYLYSGLVLGITAAVTRSVFASALIHFISNLLSIYASDSFLRVTIQKSGGFFASFIIGAVFLASLVIVLARAESIMWKRSETSLTDDIPPRSIRHLTSVFLSPGFFGLILIFLLITLLK